MKLKRDMWQVTSDEKNSAARSTPSRHLSPATRHPDSAVALVITVILLAMVTLLAITFLAVTRRQRNAVTTTTDTATAQYAAKGALAAAEAQIMANTLATTNPYNFGLLVSTNYINGLGFTPGSASPTNVNYDYLLGGGTYTLDDFLQNLANLYYLPRVPVYMSNLVTHAMENRFYLDLNRNGVDDPNGWWPELGNDGLPIVNGGVTNYMDFVGDPDWVGILQHPDQPYGPNNPFVARYAFIAVPIGNALDLNHIFNQALDENATPAGNPATISVNPSQLYGAGLDAFLRNQGVGSWEINLAAFLADLNTNEWGQILSGVGSARWYQYNQANPTPPGPSPNQGHAFDDARGLLAYRYQNNYATLASADSLFPSANDVFPIDNIDEYSDGPLQTTPAPIVELGYRGHQDRPGLWWAGAPNTNLFFDPQDLFDPDKANIGAPSGADSLTNRLLTAGRGLSTYNRYTYYRWLSQMGVDSAPEQDQINLNYSNACAYFYTNQNGALVLTNITFYPGAETNLTQWTPLQFFTIAADRMLRTYSKEWMTESPSNYVATYCMTTNISTDPIAYPTNMPIPFGISDIPVLISNRFVYTPAIQRVLQLAANIYDATTNNATPTKPDYPSVFRPIFNVVPVQSPYGQIIYTNVYIAGYETVDYDGQMGAVRPPIVGGTNDYQLTLPVRVTDLLNPSYQIPYYGYLPFSSGSGIYNNVNVYGVPWIIGAKKGFPNFNEFAMESTFLLTRKLQVTRQSTNDTYTMNPDHYNFNQMFNLSLSNQLAVECWNSYSNFYQSPDGQPRSVIMYVNDTLSVTLTNDEYPFSYTTNFYLTNVLQIPHLGLTAWPGYNPTVYPLSTPASFQLPLNVNISVIPKSMYRFNVAGDLEELGHGSSPYLTTNLDYGWGNSLFESSLNVESKFGQLYPQPHWWLITTNHVRAVILDTTDPNFPQVIDYVQLSGPNSVRDLSLEIMTNYDDPFNAIQASGNELWNTNLDQSGVPIGIQSQIGVSEGNYTAKPGSGVWNTPNTNAEIDGFMAFLGYSPQPSTDLQAQYIALAQTSRSNQVPYSPVASVIQIADWQVNDPLVHYLGQDIDHPGIEPSIKPPIPPNPAPTLTNSDYAAIGHLNTQYMPWGGHQPVNPSTPDFNTLNAYNLALKDPLVWRSDDWDFPTYKFPGIGWLGRVHRGTPWQTVYLKSPDVLREIQVNAGGSTNYLFNGLTNVWVPWTGDSNPYDAENTAPVQDRLLFDLFSTAPNANATRGQLSVNVDASNPSSQAGLAAWSALFSGVQVLSNTVPDGLVSLLKQHNGSLAAFTTFPINPAGPVGTNSPVGQIVTGINQTRANANKATTVVYPGKSVTYEIPASFANANGVGNVFEHVGDILAVPQLSVASPFLNTSLAQQEFGISDEMYDWLPQQVLSLLRVSGTPQSPMRYVIYSYGQALKPAPGAIYTGSGPYFGMVTNYQVVAESASRAVVNFGSVVTNVLTTNADNAWISVPVVTNNTVQLKGTQPLPPY